MLSVCVTVDKLYAVPKLSSHNYAYMHTPTYIITHTYGTRMHTDSCLLDHTQELQEALNGSSGSSGLDESSHLVELAFSLLLLKVPNHWVDLVGQSAPPVTWPLKEWVQDIVLRFVFLDRVLIGGLSKTPTYWLGGFFNPTAFLSVVQQVSQYVTLLM